MDTNALLKGIDRACLFASEWRNNNVHLEILDNYVINSHFDCLSTVGKISFERFILR
ncbi:hypothetical protein J7E95_15765 [Streptomyces sp. ISL-14]|nr:hypothetical protein [Streptomyces sp. ISL-14]